MVTGNKIELEAKKRDIFGRKVRSLRNTGYIPAVLYGRDQEAISLQVQEKDFYKTLKEAGESTLVYLNVGGQAYPTIIHEVDRDPVKDHVIHADFYKVSLDEKITADVPIVFNGVSQAVTGLGGIFVANMRELEVEAFPQDMPHEIKVDISSLEHFNDHILIKDVKLPANIKVIAEADAMLALVQEPKSEEDLEKELEATTGDVADVEIGKEKKEGEEDESESDTDEKEKPKEEK
jgi:large subunit ribosomal protein L25